MQIFLRLRLHRLPLVAAAEISVSVYQRCVALIQKARLSHCSLKSEIFLSRELIGMNFLCLLAHNSNNTGPSCYLSWATFGPEEWNTFRTVCLKRFLSWKNVGGKNQQTPS